MAAYVLGKDAAIYWAAAGATAPGTEITNVRDVTLNLSAGEADYTTRGNSGWRATAPTLRECSVDFQMVWNPTDTAFDAIKEAFLNSTLISLAVLDQPDTVTGAEGPLADFSITSFTRNEALEDVLTVDVTAKVADWGEWYVQGAA